MYFRPLTREDCPFLASLFDNEEYERYFAENDTTEEEFTERFEFWSNKEKSDHLRRRWPALGLGHVPV